MPVSKGVVWPKWRNLNQMFSVVGLTSLQVGVEGCSDFSVANVTHRCSRICRTRRQKMYKISTAFKNLQLKESHCPKFPLKEVYLATNNLSDNNLIGEGTAGKVYKGILSNNQHVAIKHIINDGNAETVVREVTSLLHVTHPNLVALLGYCVREDECFLIYELCPNGNLSEWIFGKDKILSWIQRLEIAVDSARGLQFLHTYSEGCIVHRDIKPTNILLGPNFEAKLSDFGLSKVINQAKSLTRGGSIIEFADPKLDGEYSAEAFVLTFHLALSCTSLKQQRPSMERVVVKLEEALDVSTRAKASTPETTPNRLSFS
ncbi:hypothetical protein GH714_010738 [Hevea brasiliensis]|uniref:non-specific serine/threonine protein kinase n=1 Tax=Hevea brasiliensis TaxID=3981 RepID=A0A6A6M7P0_HEVBR|nr:hypothetical protein GH714_010738 [Hevea brasiliensis]